MSMVCNKISHLFISFLMVMAVSITAQAQENTQENTSSNQPIEITADELEVLRMENKAIFTGKVEAVQGDMTLHSDIMTVFYTQKDSNKKADEAGGESAIERINAVGNVFLSTPDETAQGATGDYNLTSKEVKLNDNVVLTRGKNVVKGDFFVYNLETGRSKIWSESNGGVNAVDSDGEKPQRVRSIFIPKSDSDNE